ncbi:MAG: substrate-binding domain-containing protein [Propionivibrio sp.]
MGSFAIRRTVLAIVAATTACIAMPAFASKEKPVIGFSIDDLSVERWARDRDYFVSAAKQLGAEVSVQSADGDSAKQVAQIENLIAKQVDVLVIVPKDGATLINALKEARKAGIKVVSYDRLIKSPDVNMYISFDNERVGFMQGEALIKALPKGKVYVMSGDPGDNNAKLFKAGALKAMEPSVKAGDIKILGEQAVKDWLPQNALKIAENVLTQFNNDVQGFLAPNDGTAGGIIQALAGQKLAGKVIVTGQDADLTACKRVLEGTQTMTIYKSLQKIAGEAARISVGLVKGEKLDYKTVKVDNVESVLLDPIAITKSNMDLLIKDGFFSKEQLGM